MDSITFTCIVNSSKLTWRLDGEEKFSFSLMENDRLKTSLLSYATLLEAYVGELKSAYTLYPLPDTYTKQRVSCDDREQVTHLEYVILGT